MTDEHALLRAILADPADDLPRLVYADWLDEHGEAVTCGRCAASKDGQVYAMRTCSDGIRRNSWGGCLDCSGTGRTSDGRREYAEFIRVQVELGVAFAGAERCVCRAAEDKFHCGWCLAWEQTEGLRERERALFDSAYPDLPAIKPGWSVFPGTWAAPHHYTPTGHLAIVRRGFVAEIRLPLAAFLRHAADLFAAHPVERVVLPATAVDPDGGNDTYYLGGLGSFPQRYWSRLEGLPTRRAVLEAASAACVSFGRERAGLPPQE